MTYQQAVKVMEDCLYEIVKRIDKMPVSCGEKAKIFRQETGLGKTQYYFHLAIANARDKRE